MLQRNLYNKKDFGATTALLIFAIYITSAVFSYIRAESWQETAYYWTALFILVASLPYMKAALTKRFILYEPLYLFLGVFVIGHVIYMFLPIDQIDLDLELCLYIMKILFLGVIAFFIGYGLKLSKAIAMRLPLKNFNISNKILFKIPAKLYFIGWSLRLIPKFVEKIPLLPPLFGAVIQKIFGWYIIGVIVANSIYIALMIDGYLTFSDIDAVSRIAKRKKYLPRLAFFFIAEILYSLGTSTMKEGVLIPILLMFIIYFKAKKRIPYVALVTCVMLYASIIMPFMGTYRKKVVEADGFRNIISETYSELYLYDQRHKAQIEVIKRLSAPLEMSLICMMLREENKRVSAYSGFFDYLSRFVPRFIWPDKPIVDYNLMGKEMGILLEDDYITSISPTLIGALILNHGIYSVIIGMFIIGFILRIYWEWLIVRTDDNLLSFCIYFLALYSWLKLEELPITLHSNLAFFIYSYFMMRFVVKYKFSIT